MTQKHSASATPDKSEISMDFSTAVFYLIAAITLGSAMMVAFSRNIIYSAFSLLGTFAGVAGIYVFLGADFVAAVQLLIYVGGILVLILFAVMLTHRITDVKITNRTAGRIPALIIIGILIFLLVQTIRDTPWAKAKNIVHAPTTARIGDLFLDAYLLPFELASLVLLAALIGAVVISRKEIRE
jgi:NADH-quinone oxidoreductase subunit J